MVAHQNDRPTPCSDRQREMAIATLDELKHRVDKLLLEIEETSVHRLSAGGGRQLLHVCHEVLDLTEEWELNDPAKRRRVGTGKNSKWLIDIRA